jgi:hypothetical protein
MLNRNGVTISVTSLRQLSCQISQVLILLARGGRGGEGGKKDKVATPPLWNSAYFLRGEQWQKG